MGTLPLIREHCMIGELIMSLDIPSISPQELMDRIGTPHAPMLFDVQRREVFDAADRLLGGANWRHHQEINAWIEEIPPSAEIVV